MKGSHSKDPSPSPARGIVLTSFSRSRVAHKKNRLIELESFEHAYECVSLRFGRYYSSFVAWNEVTTPSHRQVSEQLIQLFGGGDTRVLTGAALCFDVEDSVNCL